jgi:hypothetical protein
MLNSGFPEFVWLWCQRQGMSMPRHHLRIAEWLQDAWVKGERRLSLLAFRGAGKSTVVGLFCCWLLRCDPNLRILVLAADQALAEKMAVNVRRIVERHPLTGDLRPARPDQWAADRFTVARPLELRDPSVLARGVTANVTGSRADVIICDDVEVPNTCGTAAKREELRARLSETAYILVPGGLRLFVGTPHSSASIYAPEPDRGAGESQPFLSGFARFDLPLVDSCGRSAWPERFPLARIEEIRRASGPNRFASQMLLKPVDVADGRLDSRLLRRYDDELDYREGNGEARLLLMGRRLVSASCWWDPAYGKPGRGDASAVAAVFTDAQGRYYLHRVAYLTHDPHDTATDEATQLCRRVADFARDLHLPSVTVEANGIGRFLPGRLRQVVAERRAPVAVVAAESRRPKAERILQAFDALLASGALYAHESVFATRLLREMQEWRPGAASGDDDGLDAVAGCLLAEPVRLPRLPPAKRQVWRSGSLPTQVKSDFQP